MTMGGRIQELRKQKAMSQEALGEALGVSRQAISKWEGDTAIPEVDKLVALSRLFGISVGALLGVEQEENAPQELTERELWAIESIVDRYLDEAERRRPKSRRWPWILAAAAAVIALVVIAAQFSRVNQNMDRNIQNLQFSLSSVTDDVNRQISSITGRVEELLQQQNDVTAQNGYEVVDLGVENDTLILRLYAAPKQYTEGMTAQFQVESPDFSPMSFEGTASGTTFSCMAELPISDEIRLSVIFDDGTEKRTQVMDTVYGLAYYSRPELYAYFLGGYEIYPLTNGIWVLDGDVELHCNPVLIENLQIFPEKMSVCVYRNGALEEELPVDMALLDQQYGPVTVPFQRDIPVSNGDRIALVGQVVDNYGRTTQTLILGGSIAEDRTGQLGLSRGDELDSFLDES